MTKKEDKKIEDNKKVVDGKLAIVSEQKQVCGIIMPISPIDGCSAEHWKQVKDLLSEAILEAGFKPSLVSDADDSGIIQKRIVQNIYDNEIVVCDVSGKNPNVMFELGMRLAFDKPTIIVVDDKTSYSFDTAPIEHLQYPRDLCYYSIIDFKNKLKDKITATIQYSQKDPNYTTFLKHFGEFEVSHVEKKQGTMNDVILSKIDDLTRAISGIQKQISQKRSYEIDSSPKERIQEIIKREIDSYCDLKGVSKDVPFLDLSINDFEKIAEKLETYPEIRTKYRNRKSLIQTVMDATYLL